MTGYFDTFPKFNRKFLYKREKEYEQLKKYVTSGARLILIVGLRRMGKTSLFQCFKDSEPSLENIYLDMRNAGLKTIDHKTIIEKKTFLEYFESVLNNYINSHNNRAKFVKLFESIKGINFSLMGTGAGIRFDYENVTTTTLTILIQKLDEFAANLKNPILLIIDEAQHMGKIIDFDMNPVIAGWCDQCKNIKIILTGSEVGLLYEFLKFDNYKSDMFNRTHDEIYVGPFDHETSKNFLNEGLDESGKIPTTAQEKQIITRAAIISGGRPGFLVDLGNQFNKNGINEVDLEGFIDSYTEASKEEFYDFIKIQNKKVNYEIIVKYLSNIGSDAIFNDVFVNSEEYKLCLRKLMEAKFLEKIDQTHYKITDPILESAFKQDNFKLPKKFMKK